MEDQKSLAEAYQPLFDLMSKEHNLTLVQSEMDEIIAASQKVVENVNELWRLVCDIDGCNETQATGGMYLQEYGYISLCSKHTSIARNKEPLKIKKEAIEREKTRDENGYLKEWPKI